MSNRFRGRLDKIDDALPRPSPLIGFAGPVEYLAGEPTWGGWMACQESLGQSADPLDHLLFRASIDVSLTRHMIGMHGDGRASHEDRQPHILAAVSRVARAILESPERARSEVDAIHGENHAALVESGAYRPGCETEATPEQMRSFRAALDSRIAESEDRDE